MRKYLSIILVSIMLLTGCASQQRQSAKSNLSLFLSTNRNLNLEPCGCALGPTGGFVREQEFLDREQKSLDHDSLVLSGGSTFSPAADTHGEGPLSLAQKMLKAKTMVAAMNLMHTAALGLIADDFSMGISNLSEISKSAQFPFVASNLRTQDKDQMFWKQSLRIPSPNYSVAIYSLSPKPLSPVAGLVWEDPATTLRKLVDSLPAEKNRLIIVLSSLTEEEINHVIQIVPEANIFAGSRDPVSSATVQMGKSNLFTNAMHDGQKVLRMDIHFNEELTGMYNEKSSRIYAEFVNSQAEEMSRLEREIASATKARRKELRSRLEGLRALKVRAEKVPKTASPRYAEYSDAEFMLTRDWEPAADKSMPMKQLMEKYKEQVRELAMKMDRESDT